MARPLRIELAGGFYHVIAHGNGRLWLFKSDEDRRQLLKLLGACVFKYKVVVHSFVLMTNHFHLLVETSLPNLSHFMRKILSDYALYYNLQYRRRGSVFRARYGSRLIQKDNYYLMVVKYLYNNPVKVGLVKNPYKYRWSSLHYLLHPEMAEDMSWYQVDDLLALVGGERGLAELMDTKVEQLPVVYRTFIGDKEWADKMISDNYDKINDEISSEKEMRKGVIEPNRIISFIAQAYQITNKALITGQNAEAKRLCLYILYKDTPLGAKEIGNIFGMSKWAVSKVVNRMEQRGGKSKEMKMVVLLRDKMSNVQT